MTSAIFEKKRHDNPIMLHNVNPNKLNNSNNSSMDKSISYKLQTNF